MRLAMSPTCSCVEVATRLSFWPMPRDRMRDEGPDDRRDEGQDRVDPQHRGDQRDDGRDLAQEHGREPRQRFLDEGEIGREALRQRGRALAPELGEIGVDEMRVERRLHVGLDAGHDAVGQDREAEEREALDRRDDDARRAAPA